MADARRANINARPDAHQHLGEEVADVLMYLVQLADRSGIDLEAAVERKLLLNARKYPPPPQA